MADGGLTISIDEALAQRVRAAAEAVGVSPEDFVAELVARQFASFGDFDWEGDLDPAVDLQIAEEAVRSDELLPADEVVRWMRSWFTADELPPPGRTESV